MFSFLTLFAAFALIAIHVIDAFRLAPNRISQNFARTSLTSFASSTGRIDAGAQSKEHRMRTLPTHPNGPLSSLCDTSRRACLAVTPLIKAFYNSLTETNTCTKNDSSAFTIADGILQCLLTNYLFSKSSSDGGQCFRDIVGEEDCRVNIEKIPYTVNNMLVPPQFTELIDQTKQQVMLLSNGIDSCDMYKTLTIFIDPIDGTKEFILGMGEQCTICIGFSDERGHPVAGVVYRPFDLPWAPHLGPTWASGAKSENYLNCHLDNDCSTTPPEHFKDDSLLTSNGTVSNFLLAMMEKLGYERYKSGGAGNKMLMLLEGKGSAYIQDRGVSRWDTCAAQACLEAQGGLLCKLTSFLSSNAEEEGYKYLRSQINLDFEKDVACLSIYNARLPLLQQLPLHPVNDVTEVKPYSNMCGLLALSMEMNTLENKKRILDAAKVASQISPPAFD
jgi:3'-phosphoadenosine 5'-phosphosulfate (PAPS) 3'-phosphatase